ncbi:amino acid adenylation domain-containing protein [Burkholderia orbicola]|uniref:Amino acid adenylation domain protein n=2 Tax=Burkholderia cepacia complex TaxID=87882 RepID=B1K6Q3_BURO0|nr:MULTISPECIES: amino acid adenylation domain-containing protein [Burkholderia cepacia complex]ACA93186.1 amino acid adenylation domain protein [Burkholderia orbicola MC0-3]MDN7994681.1 amino acid adenylation domain-containing protein [Burkholderia orbicola]HEM7899854.1 amino acid adenylation domain-containing protein [Burkholderia cenocepacia]
MKSLRCDEAAWSLHERINQTSVPYPDDASIGELFDRVVARRPDAAAVIAASRTCTYRELDDCANALAWRLIDEGVRPGDVVALVLPRGVDLVAALLAIVKAGAAYLPLDAAWPAQRIAHLLEQTGCRHALHGAAGPAPAALGACRALPVSIDALREQGRREAPHGRATAASIAYINFTSGSTGQPKGVPIEHRSVARLVFGARYARLDTESRVLQMAPVTFDAATFEIWGPLLNGGACVVYEDGFVRASRLRDLIERHRINLLFLTTALFNALVDEAPATLASVETVLTGGEAHSLRHMNEALRRYGADRIVSVYGPTECTTFTTWYPVREIGPDETMLPIGLPIQNTRLYVVDQDALCRAGEPGEICVAGPGLTPGYLGMPEITRERFVEYEIAGRRERLYHTGDIGYLREDGVLVFKGRLDDQVKINGFRIEFGEIAFHLQNRPEVRRSYVTVHDNGIEKRLVAFVVPKSEGSGAEQIRAALAEVLPAYMVPAQIHLCDELPISANGKIDHRHLKQTLE